MWPVMSRRIAILTHSTNPRGGVVHGMQLAEALDALGEEVTLIAPALPGATFFRTPRCRFRLIPAMPARDTADLVARRVGEIAAFLHGEAFDIWHAQDPITANALAALKQAGAIPAFARTVHHLDAHTDPRLAAWQQQGWQTADQLFCVSHGWQAHLAGLGGRAPDLVGNGVDLGRYTPQGAKDAAVRQRLGLPSRFLLALGGVEARKNTRAILAAFAAVQPHHPDLSLVIAGGASLLDHRAEQQLFRTDLSRLSAATQQAVRLLGVVEDADMPPLYRLSAGLVSPSRMEGFGLCAIEALACGRPAIVSAMAPFTEHLGADEALWAEPDSSASIAGAIATLLTPAAQHRFRQTGPATAARFSWSAVARRHLPGYAAIAKVPAHA